MEVNYMEAWYVYKENISIKLTNIYLHALILQQGRCKLQILITWGGIIFPKNFFIAILVQINELNYKFYLGI